MGRGGRAKERDAPERRCVVTGERSGTYGLIRFVLDPDGVVTPDLSERLPGRGVWVASEAAVLEKAVRRGAFSRGFKAQVRPPADLIGAVQAGLVRRAIESLSLARKAGQAVAGYEKVRFALPEAELLVLAADGAEGGKRKMRRLAGELPIIECLDKAELGLAFGRPYVIHVCLLAGGLTSRLRREAARLSGVRGQGSAAAHAGPDQESTGLEPGA